MIKAFRKPYRVKRLQPVRHIRGAFKEGGGRVGVLRQRRRHLKSIFRNRLFWISLLILITSGIVFYFAIFGSTFQIKEIKVSGNQKVSTEDLRNVIQEQINQKIFIFSNKNIFLVNLNKTNKIILEKFPQIAKVSLKRDFPDILILEVRERIPIGIWCQNSNCFSIDQEGIIFEEGFQEGELVIKSQEQKFRVSLGKRVIEKEDLNLILEIQKKIKDYHPSTKEAASPSARAELPTLTPPPVYPGIEVKEFTIISPERLNVKTSEGWEIYFNPKGDLNWQITELEAVLEKHIPLQRRGELKYIDLRFSKVFIYPEFK